MEANCILCKFSVRLICEKTQSMKTDLLCLTFDEVIDHKTAVDPNAQCDYFELDDEYADLRNGNAENGDQ